MQTKTNTHNEDVSLIEIDGGIKLTTFAEDFENISEAHSYNNQRAKAILEFLDYYDNLENKSMVGQLFADEKLRRDVVSRLGTENIKLTAENHDLSERVSMYQKVINYSMLAFIAALVSILLYFKN